MHSLYNRIGESLSNQNEIIDVTFTEKFENAYQMKMSAIQTFYELSNEVLTKRQEQEKHFYDFLLNQLLHRLNEIKAYSEVNIFDSRRMIAVSTDCITSIQIVVRDDIHLIVNMRSSDYNGALPCDLQFLCGIPFDFLYHLSQCKEWETYKEVSQNSIEELFKKEVRFSISFGSLHKTKN